MIGSNAKIVTAYEDSESFAKISKLKGLFESTGCILTQEETTAIDFSRFWTEQSWGRAVVAATNADLIIVSLSGRTELPLPVQRWMESWPHYERVKHPSLVVVFGSEESNVSKQNALITYFQQIAESHGLDFFCNRTDPQAFVSPSGSLHLN